MGQQYDVTFKYLFRNSRGVLARMLFGDVVEWPNIEQPEVRNLRADLLARSADGVLRQVELQTTNDAEMAFRMLDYYAGFYRLMGEHVEQTVLYAGREALRMRDRFETRTTRHQFTILNLREMDGEELLASDDWADNEWALLTKANRERVFRVVFDKLRTLEGAEQEAAASTFAILGGILGIEDELARRLRSDMIDLMENKILGPAIRQGLEQGRAEGRAEEAVRVLRRQLERRFGMLPEWAITRLNEASAETLDTWSLRVVDESSLEKILS